MFLLGCVLAMQIADATIPDSVRRAAMGDETVAKLARDILWDVGNESVPTRVDPRRFSFRMVELRENPRDRLRYFVDTLTAPSGLEMRLIPLPQRLWPAYRLFVPLLRYVAVPIGRVLRRFAWRVAGREHSPSS
jgi:hypothetical protein